MLKALAGPYQAAQATTKGSRATSGLLASTSSPSAPAACSISRSSAMPVPEMDCTHCRALGTTRLWAAPRPESGIGGPDASVPANWLSNQTGTDEPMHVAFRQCNTYRLWIWLELYNEPTQLEKDTLDAVFTAWFTLGRCGGFNAQNMQVFYQGEGELTEFPYDLEPAKSGLDSTFHDFGEFETRGRWCRSWVNMGTADEFSMDILINSLTTVSKESIGIRSMLIGGDNPDWPANRGQEQKRPDLNFAGMDLQDY